MIRPVRVLVVSSMLVGLAAVTTGSPAGAVATCTIDQLTGTGVNDNFANTGPGISADGEIVVFESNQNHTGSNLDGNQEIFRYDIAAETFIQVTSTTGGTFTNRDPAVDTDGGTIYFTSDRNINSDNADLNRELVRWQGGGMFSATTVITDTVAPIVNKGPTVDNAGNRVVFASDRDGNQDLYLYRHTTGATTRVTTTPAEDSDSSEISGSGRHVVFRSNGDVAGTNPDNSSEVYLRNLDTGVTTAVTTTADPVENVNPTINANGRRLAFESDGNLAGQNPDPSPELFLRETTAQTTEALTAVPDSAQLGIGATAMNAAGSRVAFESDEDYVGNNADGGFEVYLRDFGLAGERITQVTDSAASSGEVDIDRSGSHVVFSSRGNPTGGNADGGREIFLATCSAPPPPAQCDGQLVTVNRSRGETPTIGNDVIRGTNAADTVNAKAGRDRFCGLNGADTFNGANGDDRAFGGGGNDRLRGDAGNDTLNGEAGNDQLNGGPGPDTCNGGAGTDTATACTTRIGVP